jgi:hypothetical protein
MLGEYLKSIQFRNVGNLHQRAVHFIGHRAAVLRGLPLAKRDAYERHNLSLRR